MQSLISTEQLAAILDDANVVVIDASMHLPAAERDARAEYLAGHIPGARFMDLASLKDETSAVPSALPRPEQLAERLAGVGATPDSRIVFYDDSAIRTAARAWFLCCAHGLEHVSVLDGGFAKWKAEGRAVEAGEPDAAGTAGFELPSPTGIRFKSDMLANIESGDAQVLDARDSGRFSGEVEDTIHNLPSGHIPASCNLPFGSIFNPDGTMKSGDALRAAFEQSGVDLSHPIVTTCGSGVTASVLLLGLDQLGHAETALYDGSWLDWASDAGTPKAQGSGA